MMTKIIDLLFYLLYLFPIVYIFYEIIKKRDYFFVFLMINTTVYYIIRVFHFYIGSPFVFSSLLVNLFNFTIYIICLFLLLPQLSRLHRIEILIICLSVLSFIIGVIPKFDYNFYAYIYSIKELCCVFAGSLLIIWYRVNNKFKDFHFRILSNFTISFILATGLSQLLYNYNIFRYSLDVMYSKTLYIYGSWNLSSLTRYWGYFNDFQESYYCITILFIVSFYYNFFKKKYISLILLFFFYLLCNTPNLERSTSIIAVVAISPILFKLLVRGRRITIKISIALLFIIVFIMLFGRSLSENENIQIKRFHDLKNISKSDTVISRIYIWKLAGEKIDYNIFGKGMAVYFPSGQKFMGVDFELSPHNEFLMLLLANGIILGSLQIILLFLLYLSFYYRLITRHNLVSVGCFFYFTIFLINSFFNYSFYGNVSRLTLWGLFLLNCLSDLPIIYNPILKNNYVYKK